MISVLFSAMLFANFTNSCKLLDTHHMSERSPCIFISLLIVINALCTILHNRVSWIADTMTNQLTTRYTHARDS